MRNLREVDRFRRRDQAVLARYGDFGDDTCGVFEVPSPIDGAPMMIIASAGGGWDHVSVSRRNRCPNWPEMEHVKRLFFLASETAVQFHVPEQAHISVHDYCLHIWRPQTVPIPRPPGWMVGGVPADEADRLAIEAGDSPVFAED